MYSRDKEIDMLHLVIHHKWLHYFSRGLCFQPTPSGRVKKNQTESIVINLEVFDGHVETLSDKTLVTVSHPSSTVILPFDLNGSPDSETGSEFGNAVAVNGKTMVVGSYLKDSNDIDSGGVYIYDRGRGGAMINGK